MKWEVLLAVASAAVSLLAAIWGAADALSLTRQRELLNQVLHLQKAALKKLAANSPFKEAAEWLAEERRTQDVKAMREFYKTYLGKDAFEAEKLAASTNDKAFVRTVRVLFDGQSFALVLSAGLVRATIKSILDPANQAQGASSSILGLMLGARVKAYGRGYACLVLSLAVGAGLQCFEATKSPYGLGVTLPLLAIGALFLNQKLLEFRVSRGYFANNGSEVAEFILFVQSHTDKSDFGDGDKMKRVFPDPKEFAKEPGVGVYGGAVA